MTPDLQMLFISLLILWIMSAAGVVWLFRHATRL
jgi:cell division protein FtsL